MIPDLHTRIDRVIPSVQGWCSLLKGHTLASLVVALRPDVVCEIGLFGGRSFIPLAMACKEVGHGHVVGIDSWNPQVSAENEVEANVKFWGNLDHDKVYKDFMWKLNSLGLSDICTIHRKRSDDVEPPRECQIFHCDGNHSIQSIKDVQRFAPNITVGGIAVLDDLDWEQGNVGKAVKELLSMGFRELYRVNIPGSDNWAVFQRVK